MNAVRKLVHPFSWFSRSSSCEIATFKDESVGFIGQGELKKNVRILFLNGIRHSCADCVDAAQKISEIAKARIDYVHSSLGFKDAWFFTKAVCNAGEKVSNSIRTILSQQAHCTLIIVVHSAGGLVLKEALSHLSGLEKSRLSLLTFGSTYAFPESIGCSKITNVVSQTDIFSRLAHIRKTGGSILSLRGGWSPLREHAFLGRTYFTKLGQLLGVT